MFEKQKGYKMGLRTEYFVLVVLARNTEGLQECLQRGLTRAQTGDWFQSTGALP